jgi:hypothetical protein
VEEKKFAEKLLASLGSKSENFANAITKAMEKLTPEDEIVDAPKVEIDKYDYKQIAVSWKKTGISEEREAIREIIKTELLWKTQDDGFIGALEWMLGELNERDARDAAEETEQQ